MINFKNIVKPTPRLTMATPQLVESGSRRLSDSPSFLLNIKKPTPRLGESESQQLPDSVSRRVAG